MIAKIIPKNSPLVSVIMLVFNSEKYVGEAIQSILNQTYRNFELIIIDGGSTDKSLEIITKFHAMDNRIKIIHQTGKGIPSARNEGCKFASGNYIAIMDSDDIAIKNRLEKQVTFFEKNSDVGICGSWVKTVGEISTTWKHPCDNDKIKGSLLFFCPFAHSSVMMRKDAIPFFPEPYTESYDTAEDYDLWVKCMNYAKYSNLSIPLVLYRIHQENNSVIYKGEQKENSMKIQKNLLNNLNISPSENELCINNSFYARGEDLSEEYLLDVQKWLSKLYEANSIKKLFPESILFEMFSEMWYRACIKKTANGLRTWNAYRKSSFTGSFRLSKIRKVKLFVYCLIKKDVK
jgi:glycosyltransferase involved in cell wall biosynthesis